MNALYLENNAFCAGSHFLSQLASLADASLELCSCRNTWEPARRLVFLAFIAMPNFCFDQTMVGLSSFLNEKALDTLLPPWMFF